MGSEMCIRDSPTGAPSWRISRDGSCHASLHLQSLRRLQQSPTGVLVGESPGRDPCHACQRQQRPRPSGRLLPAHPVVAYSRRGPLSCLSPEARPCRLRSTPTGTPTCMPLSGEPLPRRLTSHTCVASCYLLPAHLASASPERGPCYAFLRQQRPRCLWLSPTGAPRWCISPGRGPCHAFLPVHAHVASSHLLPAPPVGASPGKALATPHYLGMLRPSPVVSYRRP